LAPIIICQAKPPPCLLELPSAKSARFFLLFHHKNQKTVYAV
jgi:hypothetical protein